LSQIDKLNPQKLPVFTHQQLAHYNGVDRPEIWVAYKGKIYEVSHSRLWRNGLHYGNWAGQDLTEALIHAPHTDSVFERFEIVGKLYSDEEKTTT